MAAKNERDLLEIVSRRGSGLEHETSGLQSKVSCEWDNLRLALEGQDSIGRRRAASRAIRFWRSLEKDQKGKNVRFWSSIWSYYYLEKNQSSKLNAISEQLKTLSERTGIVALRAEGLLAEGLHLLTLGKASEAVDTLELSRALLVSTRENDFDVIRCSILLASAFRLSGNRASAVSILERAREKCLQLEEIPLLASIAQTLGMNYLETGDLQNAQRCFEFARDSSKFLGSRKRELRANLGLTMSLLRRGAYEKALPLATTSLEEAMQFQLPREVCLAYEFIGQIHVSERKWKPALYYFSRMNKQAISSVATLDIGVELHRRLADLWIAAGQPTKTRFHINRGLALARNGGEREDSLALERLNIEIEWDKSSHDQVVNTLIEHGNKIQKLGYGYEYLINCYHIVKLMDMNGGNSPAAEWWARVEFLAKSCGAEPLLERWRKERQEKGYLPQTSPDGLDGEPGPNSRLAQELPPVDLSAYNIITRSRQLHEQAASIGQVASTTVPVLIHGESGTGKELFAKLVHDLSPRKGEAFLAINCGALPSELLESELFGHRRGSFTGAISDKPGLFRAAHKGTLFLDEIGEMSAPAQTKLLRVLEAGEVRRVGDTQVEFVDVRIVAATNVDLEREVKSGKFRQDLYYRLKGLEVFLPPLRERMSDIPLLADYFLNRANQLCHKQLVLPFETKQWLMGLPWLGNVRELRLSIERAAALGPQIGMLQPYHFMGAEQTPSKSSLTAELEEIERSRVLHALDACKGNKAAAAKLLGMSRTTLGGKIQRLGIDDLDSRD